MLPLRASSGRTTLRAAGAGGATPWRALRNPRQPRETGARSDWLADVGVAVGIDFEGCGRATLQPSRAAISRKASPNTDAL